MDAGDERDATRDAVIERPRATRREKLVEDGRFQALEAGRAGFWVALAAVVGQVLHVRAARGFVGIIAARLEIADG